MKKRVNPELLRHILFPVHMNFNDVIKKKDAQALIFFQDNEIKHNLPRYFALFDIMCLDCQIIRSAFSLNVYLTYYNKGDMKDFKKNFITKGLCRVNTTKLDIINFWFAVYEEPSIVSKFQKFAKIYMEKYTKNLTYKKIKKKVKKKTLELALFNTQYEKLKSLRKELISKYSTLSKYYQIKLNEKKAEFPLVYKPVFDFRIPKVEVPVKPINNFKPRFNFKSKNNFKPEFNFKPRFDFKSKNNFKPEFSTKPKNKKAVVKVYNPLLQYLSKKSKIKYLNWLKDIRLKRLKKRRLYRLKLWAKIRKILNIKPKPRRRFRKKKLVLINTFPNNSNLKKEEVNKNNSSFVKTSKFPNNSNLKKEEVNKNNSFQYVKVVSPSLLPKNKKEEVNKTSKSSIIKENKNFNPNLNKSKPKNDK